MPHRGVQNNDEQKKIKAAKRRKQKEQVKKCCKLAGFTILEFVLCLICFILAFYIHYVMEKLRARYHYSYYLKSVRHILLIPLPLVVSCTYLAITYVDLVSWISMRPITYYVWIMVSASGFLMFLLYAGVLLLETTNIIVYVACALAIVTGFVFFADLVFMFLNLKRFPAQYWVVKKSKELKESCACADVDKFEQEVERPLCRCGDNWDVPCTCDANDGTCGCLANDKGEPPCPCCLCNPDNPDQETDIVSTAAGEDYVPAYQVKSVQSHVSRPPSTFVNVKGYCMNPPSKKPPRSSARLTLDVSTNQSKAKFNRNSKSDIQIHTVYNTDEPEYSSNMPEVTVAHATMRQSNALNAQNRDSCYGDSRKLKARSYGNASARSLAKPSEITYRSVDEVMTSNAGQSRAHSTTSYGVQSNVATRKAKTSDGSGTQRSYGMRSVSQQISPNSRHSIVRDQSRSMVPHTPLERSLPGQVSQRSVSVSAKISNKKPSALSTGMAASRHSAYEKW
ncbi:uncharacterized protein LOC143204724 isoform X3 [Rhynchophorus ferrugineus]|uniref:uncharacterized protein LOC143204724 isoform X3 n=1 Tax=Rhynchophorus ferrugineus TaxID=354439 RepID=UPI003FCEC03D